MDEAAKLALKKEIISEQMKQFWDFCKFSQERFPVTDDSRVIPNSVQEFSEIFFRGLETVLKNI